MSGSAPRPGSSATPALRVLHCIYGLSGGGAETQVLLLARASREHGMDVAIFCVDDRAAGPALDGVPVYRAHRSHQYEFSLFGSLRAAIDDFRPDVVHAWLPPVITIPALFVAGFRRLPVVFSYRSRKWFFRPLCLPEFLLALCFATTIVSNGPVTQSTWLYRALFRVKRGRQIPNCVDVPSNHAKSTSKARQCPTRSILFVGRLTEVKNLETVLRAFSRLPDRVNWRLRLCGQGEDEAKLVALTAQLGLNENVEFLGYRSDVTAVMQSADALVLASWLEGMPNVVLEAMAIGLPCILSDILAHRAVVGDEPAALLFDPRSPEALAASLQRLFTEPNLTANLAAAGRRIAAQRTPESMARAYSDLYRSIV